MLFIKDLISGFSQTIFYFSLIDYLIFCVIFLAILLFFLLSAFLRFKVLLAGFFLLTSLILFILSPFLYQIVIEKLVKKIDFSLTHNKKLNFDDVYYVEGTIKNEGKVDFRGCVVAVNFLPSKLNRVKKIKYEVTPIFLHKEEYKKPLKIGEVMDFQIIIPSPNKEMQYTLSTKGSCY